MATLRLRGNARPMRELVFAVPKRGARALYLRIADAIRQAILDGRARPGEYLPSSRALGDSLRAHRQTVMDALGELVAEGWLVAEPRRGYRVSTSLPDRFTHASPPQAPVRPDSHAMRWNIVRDFRLSASLPTPRIRHSFRSHPDLRLFPFDEFRSCIAESLRRSPARCFGYGDPAGHAALVNELESYLRRVRALTGRRLVVTNGSQDALFLAAQVLVAPGDVVAMETPGYPSAEAAFRCAGATIARVRVDGEGVDPSAFEAAAKKQRLRLLYLTPLHQFPTTVTLSVSRRFEIYEVAARHGVGIIEDDYDHEFHYKSQPLAPLASHDPAGLVIYASSFSKVLFPSARIGVLAVPEALYEPLRGLRRVATNQSDFLMQDALARWMRSGGFERHLRKMRRVYEERRDVMSDLLAAEKERGRDLRWTRPDGGMAMWVRFPTDAARLSVEATRLGVHAPTANEFAGARSRSNFLRLGFSMQTPTELKSGVALLMQAADATFATRR